MGSIPDYIAGVMRLKPMANVPGISSSLFLLCGGEAANPPTTRPTDE